MGFKEDEFLDQVEIATAADYLDEASMADIQLFI